MPRTIPLTLKTHLDGDGTTMCFLLKITCQDGTVIAVTSLDQSVDYDDGAGVVTYSAPIGQNQSAVDASATLEVDNSEALLLVDLSALTPEKIEAGVLDYADYIVYRINWADHSQGHYIVDVGTTGAVRQQDGLAAVIELRSLAQTLKQTYNELYSLTCRAVFGSGGGSTCVSFGQCGFDADSLWQAHSVSAVDTEEPDRIFTANATPAVNGPNGALSFAPGLVRWLTGDNAGHVSEVEEISGDVITLRFGTYYSIQASDTFDIRPDCDKTHTMCKDDYDNLLNFRGEWTIPLGDESSQSVPNFGGMFSSTTEIPNDIV